MEEIKPTTNIVPIWRSTEHLSEIASRVNKIRAEERARERVQAEEKRKTRVAKVLGKRIETERQAVWAARQMSFAFESPISKALATLGVARKRVS